MTAAIPSEMNGGAPLARAGEGAAVTARAGNVARSNAYIVGRAFDVAFFLAPPALALALGTIVGAWRIDEARFWHEGRRVGYVSLALGALINAHLVAVFARSHGNREVFARHKLRFLIAPPLLIATMMVSTAATVIATVVVVLWDVYHSAAQTFGLARLYDARAGNRAEVGRSLDFWLNVVLYVGPIVAGATMLDHLGKLANLEEIGVTFFSAVPAFLDGQRRALVIAILTLGLAYTIFYVVAYVRLARQGHRVSWPKVWLLASTGACSIIAWGWNPWGQAFLVMNVFHAVQYLALVYWTDGRKLIGARLGKAAPLAFLGSALAYGVFADLVRDDDRLLWCVVQTVALLHFWYDGFIWSVRKRHVG